eukprot:290459-Hanusia_phi.AAC.1
MALRYPEAARADHDGVEETCKPDDEPLPEASARQRFQGICSSLAATSPCSSPSSSSNPLLPSLAFCSPLPHLQILLHLLSCPPLFLSAPPRSFASPGPRPCL